MDNANHFVIGLHSQVDSALMHLRSDPWISTPTALKQISFLIYNYYYINYDNMYST